jgi:hypothetical protein
MSQDPSHPPRAGLKDDDPQEVGPLARPDTRQTKLGFFIYIYIHIYTYVLAEAAKKPKKIEDLPKDVFEDISCMSAAAGS